MSLYGDFRRFPQVTLGPRQLKEQLPVLQLVLCLAVFLFAFHAKTSMYGHDSGTRVTPSTMAKLWLNGQKLEVKPRIQPAPVLFWIGVLFLHWLYLHRDSFFHRVVHIPVVRPLVLQDLHRSLRPPPLL
jgi:hypothetical protein